MCRQITRPTVRWVGRMIGRQASRQAQKQAGWLESSLTKKN
jgi:hypothetical protein